MWKIQKRSTLDGNILAVGECSHTYFYRTTGQEFWWCNSMWEVRQAASIFRAWLQIVPVSVLRQYKASSKITGC